MGYTKTSPTEKEFGTYSAKVVLPTKPYGDNKSHRYVKIEYIYGTIFTAGSALQFWSKLQI